LIEPNSLGDIVMALPALAALRRGFPHARIHWLVRPEFAPLLAGHPHLDEIVLFDRKLFARAWHSPAAARSLVAFISGLRRGRFNVVLDLRGLFRTGLVVRLPAAYWRRRAGGAKARWLSRFAV